MFYRRSKSQIGKLGTAYMAKPLKSLPKLSSSAQGAKTDMACPRFGVSWLGWSPEGSLLALREESQPRCLWVGAFEYSNIRVFESIYALALHSAHFSFSIV